ncbi:MAG: AAA family ATPase [Neisseriaceae bacterium]|nr:MAG: AAA family ATPase [Neisseriaceae bacterium]
MNPIESPLLQSLNPEQLAAVTYPNNQSLLVLAGAGSGKTRVLTSRIIWLLATKQSLPQNILAVTFTNKAAKEMRSRIQGILPYSIQDMWVGTFHSLCHRILRRYHEIAQLQKNFQIIDTQDQLSIIKRILKNNSTIDNSITPKDLVNYINNNKEQGYRSINPVLMTHHQYDLLNSYYAIYEQTCHRENLVDFTELLLRCVETLQNSTLLQESLQRRFQHILVDEFQDTNNLQYQWLKLITGNHASIFAVGDDDQSIYSFRGANVKNMQYLIQDFKIIQSIKLEQNYRSTQTILDAANELIAHNTDRIGKKLRSVQKQGELIKYNRTYSELEESQFVLEEIKSHHRNGESYSSMAILYRNNAQSRIIEQSLFNAGIPYKVYGGLRFYEREEIKHALAYLRLLVNPEDDHSLLRVINFPNRGIGHKSIENLQTKAAEIQDSLWNVLLQEKSKNKNIASFYHIICDLREQIDQLSFSDLINELIHKSGLIQYYQQKKGDFQNKIDNLHELVNATYTFDDQDIEQIFSDTPQAISVKDKITAFLSNASLEAGERNSQSSNDPSDYVQLMTVHSAKGLEFDTVFLIAMEEGLFPSGYSLNHHDSLEEERRLMYVATTRAKKNLYLSSVYERYHQGRKNIALQSRFINEIPEHLIHHLSAKDNTPLVSTPLQGRKNNVSLTDKENEPYTLGMMVKHPSFGVGVIINRQKKSHSYVLTINFGQYGLKILDSSLAKLEAI